MDHSGHESINEETSYLIRTMNMVMYGSFTNEFTWAGLGIQLVLGVFGLDAIFDARDLIADATVNRDLTSPSWLATMALDAAAIIPLVGLFKYSDDLSYGVKTLFKNGDEVLDGSRKFIRAADSLGDLSKTGRTVWDHMADSLREMAKNVKKADMLDNARYVDNAVDVVSDTGKRLDDVANGLNNKIGYEYLDEQLGSLKNKVKINQYQSAESVNDWWEARGYKSPYKKRTVVQNITLTEDAKFVRVYDGVNSNLEGGWVMRAEDIKGLTPKEIQSKFALEYEPKFIGEVELKAGDTIRLGEVGPNFGFYGGGIQIDLQQQWIGDFTELGTIEDWGIKNG